MKRGQLASIVLMVVTSTGAGQACGGSSNGGADASTGGDPVDAAAGLANTCTGGCQEQTVTASFGANSAGFDRAFYGLTISRTDPVAQVHLEAHAGGSSDCPMAGSPTPQRTLVVSGFASPADASPSQEVSVSLLDFEGSLLSGSPIARADSATVAARAASLCPECVGSATPSDPDGFVAITVDAQFMGGSATGQVYATHCDSMDVVE